MKTEQSFKVAQVLEKPTYTIADLTAGKIVIERDGSIEDLDRVLRLAFPDDDDDVRNSGWGEFKYFYKQNEEQWNAFDTYEIEENQLPVVKVSELIGEVEGASEEVNECSDNFGEVVKTAGIREFSTGSRRDDDSNKPLVNHLDPYLRLRFGYLLRQGANKYDKGNWKKLQPTETALESLHRHLAKFELNLQNGVEQDEDHLSAVIFNVMLIMKQEEKEGIATDHFYGTLK
jgi:hypothetical protein